MARHGVSFAGTPRQRHLALAWHEGGLLATAGATADDGDTGGSMSSDSMEVRYGALLALACETPQPDLPRFLGMLAEAQAEALARLRQPESNGPPADEERLADMPEVAKVLGIPEEHARELGRRGEIPTVRVGERYVRVRLSSLRQWIETNEGGRLRARERH